MKITQKEHTIIIKDTKDNWSNFITSITKQFNTFKTHNIVLDLTSSSIDLSNLKEFFELNKMFKKQKKSFVLVIENIDYNSVPSKIIVVPTLQEAHDIIEMEEIERDLGF